MRIVGYFASWGVYSRDYHVAHIPAEKLTHINYAFSNISDNGTCVLGDPSADAKTFYSAANSVSRQADLQDGLHGNFNQLLELKRKYPHVQTLISIGGWTWSGKFSDVALTDASRQTFVQSCIGLYLQRYAGVFDGVDIDWEYPVSGGLKEGRPEDKHNFTLLLAEMRRQLDAQGQKGGRRYLLTMAAPAGPRQIANLEVDQIHPYLDWINVMAYDFHIATERTTNLHAPLYASSSDPDPASKASFNADAAIRAYLQAGAPSNKLVLGVPFYGRGWRGVPDVNHGLYQPATDPAQGMWELGVFDYREIKASNLPTYSRYWQSEAQSPWLYNPATGVFITYDDAESLKKKADYIKTHHLGGAMFWELSSDGGELVDTLYESLK